MSRTVVVEYETKPDAAGENQRLVEAVYAELLDTKPAGLRYMTLRLDGGTRFVHIAVSDGPNSPLAALASFTEFQRELGDRSAVAPVLRPAEVVGSYRVFD